MTGRAHRDTGVAVEKDVAIDVRDPDAFAAFGDKFEIWARVSRVNELRVSFDYRATFRSRKFGFDLGFS